MRVEDFIEQSRAAKDVNALFSLYADTMEQYGYDRVLFALFNEHPTLQKEAEHGVLKNYPADWVAHYLEKGYDTVDPIRHQAMVGIEAFSWDQVIAATKLSKKQQRMFDEASDIGLHNGIGVPLRGAGGALAGIGAASSMKDIYPSQQFTPVANLLSQQFYLCFWRLMEKNPLTVTILLTPREKDILLHSATGKSREDVAKILNISSHTVDYHTRNIFRKLNVHTMIGAVVKSIHLGAIQL